MRAASVAEANWRCNCEAGDHASHIPSQRNGNCPVCRCAWRMPADVVTERMRVIELREAYEDALVDVIAAELLAVESAKPADG